MPSPSKGAPDPDRSKLIEASFRALEERFNEYSALPNADVPGGKGATDPPWPKGAGAPPSPSAPGAGGPKVKGGADFKVSKRIMNEVAYVNQHRQPKGVEATIEWRELVDLSGANPNPNPKPETRNPKPENLALALTLTLTRWT